LLAYIEQLSKEVVAVVGYPNVGKSSIINALKGFKVATVTKMPGGTRKIEEFSIGSIKFLDSPGIEMAEKKPADVLRATNKIENLQDPYTPVQGILEKVTKEKLLILYAIPDFKDIKEFLTHVAKKMGKVAKGGLPDFDAAAKIVLHDWFMSKIPFSTSI
jgi:nuclear GTP-binding protein